MIDGIVSEILRREGGDKYTNRASDRGGPTKWGITANAWSTWLGRTATEDDVKAITETQARNFYYSRYIDKPNFEQIRDPLIMEFVIDCGVNHGTARASRWLQQAVGVDDDGVVGPQTLKAVNAASYGNLFLALFAIRVKFYAQIASDQLPADPDLPNLQGWINRALEFLELYRRSQ